MLGIAGTGIVTSVPSDSPEDLIALRDLQRKVNAQILNFKTQTSNLKLDST